ncbi:MAG: fibro-slime domain-containing protein, partial [Chitinispirillaceae bacterium]|nr:fibro-slime domain-containing protein [Chitinispirillaceae bacterium]
MKRVNIGIVIVAVVGIFLPSKVRAQIYPETLWVPVTFYDFHSDRSNPEFECLHTGARRRNMVDSTLDAERKPRLGSQPYINYYIKYWFRPWINYARGDSTIPVYTCLSNCNYPSFNAVIRYDGTRKVNHDTAFKNIVIRDSLPFILDRTPGVPAGTYVYRNNSFFPLDNRGFGNEGKNHNFSFTMELNWKFVKVPGLKFIFRGDDDVWVFINGKLYMDIGGIHSAVSDTLNIDNIPGLVDGQQYTLDLFYAERHTTQSTIWIASNIISAEPKRVDITVYPNDTICAGDRLTAIGVVLDEKGQPIPEMADSIRWRVIPNGANNDGHLSTLRGDTTYFTPTEAYAYDGIEGRLIVGNTVIYDTIWIYVKACYPHHIVIEGTPPPFNNPALLRNDQPLAEIVIPPTSTSGRGYAIVRDTFGNFIEASDSTQWTITGGAQYLDRVVVGNKSIGEGIVYKKDTLKIEGTGEVTARSLRYPTIKTDNVAVRIQQISYDSLQISIWDGTSYRRISSLITTTDRDTDLIVRARRSDNGQWEVVSGSWSIQPTTIRTVTPPPTSAQLWEFFPIDTGRATIRVVNGSLSASISVVINPGAPAVLRLYRNAADTVGYLNPPNFYYDSAGVVFPLYAKIFDSRGVWLRQYDSLSAPIYWSIIEVSGTPPTGTLTRTMGNQNGFTPTRAGNVVDIVARFSVGSRTIADTVRIRVLPGKPDHITIQADTARNGVDLTELQIQSNQTEASLYAILRDRYGNFIDYAINATWLSADTNVVIANQGNIFLGEGKVIRNSDVVSATYVYAISEDGKMKDSVLVRLTDITYDQLRIYIITEGGKRLVDTVRIRTDESLTLYVEGRRSDGTGWDNIPAVWSKSSGLKTVGNPPSWSTNWNVIPDSVGNGIIVVSRTGAISDTVVAIFLPGLPGSVKLYRRTGNPNGAGPYPEPPAVDTFVAGTTYSIVAKVFDRNNIWLSEYESSSKDNLFSWSVALVNGFLPTDTLNKRIGYQVS